MDGRTSRTNQKFEGKVMADKSETRNIYQRLADVQAKIGYVEKDGENKFQHYKYTSEAMLIASLKPLLANTGLALIFTSKPPYTVTERERTGKEPVILTAVDCELKLVNIDKPEETITVTGSGFGIDSGDKGIYKAITGANKYMLFKLFQVSTGDDPEVGNREADQPDPSSRPARMVTKNDHAKSSPKGFDPGSPQEEPDGLDETATFLFDGYVDEIGKARFVNTLIGIKKRFEANKPELGEKVYKDLMDKYTARLAILQKGETNALV